MNREHEIERINEIMNGLTDEELHFLWAYITILYCSN